MNLTMLVAATVPYGTGSRQRWRLNNFPAYFLAVWDQLYSFNSEGYLHGIYSPSPSPLSLNEKMKSPRGKGKNVEKKE
jgi:hypothetical protein